MTLLNWELTPERVLIFNDTLSLCAEDKSPRTFMTKVYPVPHIGAVITGTGHVPFITQFALYVNTEMRVVDTHHLAQFAPDLLRAAWKNIVIEDISPANATIYVFGLGANDGNFCGYAYRSTDNFEPQLLEYSVGLKPSPVPLPAEMPESLEGFIQLALVQQASDRALQPQDQVGIGGDLWLYCLGADAAKAFTFSAQRLCRFPHSEEDSQRIYSAL